MTWSGGPCVDDMRNKTNGEKARGGCIPPEAAGGHAHNSCKTKKMSHSELRGSRSRQEKCSALSTRGGSVSISCWWENETASDSS